MPDISDNYYHLSIVLFRILISGGCAAMCKMDNGQGMTAPQIAAKVFGLLNLSSSVGQIFRS